MSKSKKMWKKWPGLLLLPEADAMSTAPRRQGYFLLNLK
jgi:hypothetical protein